MRLTALASVLVVRLSGPAAPGQVGETPPVARASAARLAYAAQVRKRLGLVPEYENVRGVESLKIAVLDYGFAGLDSGRRYLPEGAIVVEHYDPDFVRRFKVGDPDYRKPLDPANAHCRIMAQIVWAVAGGAVGCGINESGRACLTERFPLPARHDAAAAGLNTGRVVGWRGERDENEKRGPTLTSDPARQPPAPRHGGHPGDRLQTGCRGRDGNESSRQKEESRRPSGLATGGAEGKPANAMPISLGGKRPPGVISTPAAAGETIEGQSTNGGNNMPALKAVAYWRMSSSQQERSIPQQIAEMLPRAKLQGVEVVEEFKDEAISGGGMAKRDDFQRMLRYCQEQDRAGKPVDAIVCYDTARFSRADSNETSHAIWEFRQVGVNRLLTAERWFDFRK
jgi:Resolvase, N terminal domain